MDYKFSCPHCGQHVLATYEVVGATVQCPTCSQIFIVPSPITPTSSVSFPNRENYENESVTINKATIFAYGSIGLSVLTFIFVFCDEGIPWLVSAIMAIVLGHMCLQRVKRAEGKVPGTGIALTGLILGYGALFILCAFLFLSTKKVVQEAHVKQEANIDADNDPAKAVEPTPSLNSVVQHTDPDMMSDAEIPNDGEQKCHRGYEARRRCRRCKVCTNVWKNSNHDRICWILGFEEHHTRSDRTWFSQ